MCAQAVTFNHMTECKCGCVRTEMSTMFESSKLIETEGVDHIIKGISESDLSPLPLKGLSCLFDLSGLAFHTFAKDIFNRAQRDF